MDGTKSSDQPKRRACDECRGRKLACSKEIDGCARCKREGIKCVYSPQKRMGRPRKHRPVELAEPPAKVSEPREAPTVEAPPVIVPDFEFDSSIGMDLDLSFLDMSGADVNFLDLVDPNSQYLPPPAQTSIEQGTAGYQKLPQLGNTPGGDFWSMGSGVPGDINFDGPLCASTPPPAPEITPEEVAQMLSADLETLPSLSPPSSSSPSTHGSPESDGPPLCGCLSKLYLALASLQTLPKDVSEAMRVARTATRIAHDTILCPVCGDPPIDPAGKPPLQAYQNMMMLGALLPSLSNAYMRILGMVDAEAAAADKDHRNIRFTLSGYGGLWGLLAKLDPVECNASERLEGAMLEPTLWRLAVRALLKIDVYGIDGMTADIKCRFGDIQQPGLKDIIKMMEERSRRRHEQLDAMVAAGIVQKVNCDYVPLTATGEKPTCLRIIDIAKRSMDELVIP
ncbi:uncharacterized protein B0T15DRAFT_26000 [Chaetomium strumarium]|uniref:Zn(2)-C6 fungal-type domain-containing protein n=1 Tax=Chaetomium strumarium TaxID=1170767 RepID=A0AAJ0H1R6_9PEZI|nr:hypothetical protein B0T15DRAFT_26000 [Chaetomium strumarium]